MRSSQSSREGAKMVDPDSVQPLLEQPEDVEVAEAASGTGTRTSQEAPGASREVENTLVEEFMSKAKGLATTALKLAAEEGHLDVVNILIEEKGAKNVQDGLRVALKAGHSELVTFLVKQKGADAMPGLLQAAANNDLKMVKYFVEHGARNFAEGLQAAAQGGHVELVKYFAETHSAKNFEEGLKAAAAGGHMEVVRYLVDAHGAKNFEGGIQAAARGGHVELVKYFAETHSAKNFEEGLQSAAHGGHKDPKELAFMAAWDELKGDIRQMQKGLVTWSAFGSRSEVLKYVMNTHPTCFPKTSYSEELWGAGLTAGALVGDLKLVEDCEKHGAKNLKEEGFQAAVFQAAVFGGHLELVEYFAEMHSAKNVQDGLKAAAARGHITVVEYFVKERHAKNFAEGLQAAAQGGHVELVKYFAEIHSAKNFEEGLQAAAEGGHMELVEYFAEERHAKDFEVMFRNLRSTRKHSDWYYHEPIPVELEERFLRQHDTNSQSNLDMCLEVAAKIGDETSVKIAITHGAWVSAHHAYLAACHPELADFILGNVSRPTDFNYQDKYLRLHSQPLLLLFKATVRTAMLKGFFTFFDSYRFSDGTTKKNPELIAHDCDPVMKLCLDKAFVLMALLGSPRPLLSVLEARDAYLAYHPLDRWSDDLQAMGLWLDELALEMIDESSMADLKYVCSDRRVLRLLCSKCSIKAVASSRLRFVEHFLWSPELFSGIGEFLLTGSTSLRFLQYYMNQGIYACLTFSIACHHTPSAIFHNDDTYRWDAVLAVWTIAILLHETHQVYQTGLADYITEKWNVLDLGALLTMVIAIVTGALWSAHGQGLPWLLLSLFLMLMRMMHPVSVMSQEFGLIINTVFSMTLVLARYMVFVIMLICAFAVCFVLWIGPDKFEKLICGHNYEERYMLSRMVYASFLLTFEGQGSVEMLSDAFDDGDALAFVLGLTFKVVVLMMAMNLVIGVMSGEWTKNEPIAKAVHMKDSLAASTEFKWPWPGDYLPPPLNLMLVPATFSPPGTSGCGRAFFILLTFVFGSTGSAVLHAPCQSCCCRRPHGGCEILGRRARCQKLRRRHPSCS
eukprot:TRINITY_DN11983_c0_g1_i1.p1 TRINITY_DN11983_c0_g1~~TRINITY_DN11983_c0_g1_i1.p1  ORF type:complete len:1073 (+),score=238.84 TRINITY_DN11983_c0_g1_i1:88-3306(+)